MRLLKTFYLNLLFLFICANLNAQEIYTVNLTPVTSGMWNRNFYVDEVIDAREQKENMGILSLGDSSKRYELQLSKDTETALLVFFLKSYPRESQQAPIQIKVKALTINETTIGERIEVSVRYKAEYLYQNNVIYSDNKLIQKNYTGADTIIQESIEMALIASLADFNFSGWEQTAGIDISARKIPDPSPEAEVAFSNDYQINEEKKVEKNQPGESNFDDRNVTAIGYQIGGYTLIGIDYTIRMTDIIGVHFGGGLSGYTAGMKFHFKPTKKSSFINVSFKDAGFGMMQTVGAEFGGRWVFKKDGDFGLHFQVGLAGITKLDENFKNTLYGQDTDAPPATLTLGIGFSW